ncbi:unnamed protein product [Symbiodinium sp. KB8]|nr:unnamed protein product [Symbiodinium sp. KB8]
MYSSGTLAVRCTHCRSVLAAPRGHSTIACGHCGAELHIGATSGTVRTSAELRAEMARAAEEARSAAQASNAAAESSLASCEVFEADASFAAQRLECPITTEAMKEGDRVMKLPCGRRWHRAAALVAPSAPTTARHVRLRLADSPLAPRTQHMFLEESIRMWLGTSNTCPLCRAELPTRSGAARVDPERAAYDAARRVAQDHGGAPGGGAAGHGGAGSSYHSTGLRVAALPRGGGYGPGVTQRSSAQYPMARGAPQGGGWRPAPSYPPRHDGEGCCVM